MKTNRFCDSRESYVACQDSPTIDQDRLDLRMHLIWDRKVGVRVEEKGMEEFLAFEEVKDL